MTLREQWLGEPVILAFREEEASVPCEIDLLCVTPVRLLDMHKELAIKRWPTLMAFEKACALRVPKHRTGGVIKARKQRREGDDRIKLCE